MATSIARALAMAIGPRSGPRLPHPDRYCGGADYNLYRLQFNNIANLREWDYATRGRMLSSCLGDEALVVMETLPQHLHNDFAALDGALARRFGPIPLDPSEYRQLLRECQQQHEESLDSYAQRVDELVRKGHPLLGHAAQELYKVETFANGLLDSMTARLVRYTSCQTLEGALTAAKRLGPGTNQPHASHKKVRAVEVDDLALEREKQRDAKIDTLVKAFNQQLTARPQVVTVQAPPVQIVQQPSAQAQQVPVKYAAPAERASKPANSRERDSSSSNSKGGRPQLRQAGPDDECYYCHKFGHFALHCRSRLRNERQQDDTVCGYCAKPRHKSEQCRLRIRHERQADELAAANRGTDNADSRPPRDPKQCGYCSKRGHDSEVCRKRLRDEANQADQGRSKKAPKREPDSGNEKGPQSQ